MGKPTTLHKFQKLKLLFIFYWNQMLKINKWVFISEQLYLSFKLECKFFLSPSAKKCIMQIKESSGPEESLREILVEVNYHQIHCKFNSILEWMTKILMARKKKDNFFKIKRSVFFQLMMSLKSLKTKMCPIWWKLLIIIPCTIPFLYNIYIHTFYFSKASTEGQTHGW